MSLGPSNNAGEVKETPIQRIKVLGSNILKGAADRPAERLFYFGLALLIVGLPFGINFPVIYYGVLGLLGLILLCQFGLTRHDKNEDHAK